jgi:hypothetical protein
VQQVSPAMRLVLPVSIVNRGRGLAEDIFCSVEATLPLGSSASYSFRSESERHWNTTREGRCCFTITLGAQVILPPGTGLPLFSIVLGVDKKGKSDHVLSVSSGSRAGPGAAETLVLPGRIVDEAFSHYTRRYDNDADRKANESRCVDLLRECMPRS